MHIKAKFSVLLYSWNLVISPECRCNILQHRRKKCNSLAFEFTHSICSNSGSDNFFLVMRIVAIASSMAAKKLSKKKSAVAADVDVSTSTFNLP